MGASQPGNKKRARKKFLIILRSVLLIREGLRGDREEHSQEHSFSANFIS